MDLFYYKINKLLWRWGKEDGARIVPDVSLSLDRPPPAREEPKRPPAAAPKKSKPEPQAGDGLLKVMELHSRFKTWLETPDPPKPAKPSKPGKQEATVPQFDIQEIPAAMRKNHLPISAALMERWFAGRLNYSPTVSEEKKETNQDGNPYPSDMYDTTTIKLDWVLRFPRAQEQYDYLIKEGIRAPEAREVLRKKLAPYKDKVTKLDTEEISGNELASLHRHFQFQRVGVDSTFGKKINTLLVAQFRNNGAPDDLAGSLGSFILYAAIGFARFSWDVESRRTTASITGVWVYVKDNFTFTDMPGEISQYLGHWSNNGVIVVPYNAASAALNKPYLPYIDYPVALGDPKVKGNVYYPVHNGDFRRWAIKHHRGGDFIIYSDRRFVPIVPPLKIYL